MQRSVQRFQELADVVVAKARRKPQRPSFHNEGLLLDLFGRRQTQAKKMVYRSFERSA